jgi:hypothetical protein
MNEQKSSHVSIDFSWEEQSRVFEQFKQSGGFSSYVSTLPKLSEAFNVDRFLRCIDEGTENGIHAAGSGIAYVITDGLNKSFTGYEAIDAGVNAAEEAFKDASLEGIYSHEECGAAKLVYNALSEEFRSQLKNDLSMSSPDEFGDYFSKKLAERLGKDYKGRIEIDVMTRPSGLHVTRFTYVDGTGNFNPAVAEGLPQGFVISRKYLGADQTGVEASVSIDISTGDHGFGSRITPEQPYVLVAVGNPNDPKLSVESLMKELQPIAAKYGGKVIVDGFTAPMSNGR